MRLAYALGAAAAGLRRSHSWLSPGGRLRRCETEDPRSRPPAQRGPRLGEPGLKACAINSSPHGFSASSSISITTWRYRTGLPLETSREARRGAGTREETALGHRRNGLG